MLTGFDEAAGCNGIIRDNCTREREQVFRAHGRFVESLEGRYVTAEDGGTSPVSMEITLPNT